jgi:hypothetical protein
MIQYITASTSQLCIGQCRSRYTISLIIEEAYRRNKIDVNKYIKTEGYVLNRSTAQQLHKKIQTINIKGYA